MNLLFPSLRVAAVWQCPSGCHWVARSFLDSRVITRVPSRPYFSPLSISFNCCLYCHRSCVHRQLLSSHLTLLVFIIVVLFSCSSEAFLQCVASPPSLFQNATSPTPPYRRIPIIFSPLGVPLLPFPHPPSAQRVIPLTPPPLLVGPLQPVSRHPRMMPILSFLPTL